LRDGLRKQREEGSKQLTNDTHDFDWWESAHAHKLRVLKVRERNKRREGGKSMSDARKCSTERRASARAGIDREDGGGELGRRFGLWFFFSFPFLWWRGK
jgi:hypothetical protein